MNSPFLYMSLPFYFQLLYGYFISVVKNVERSRSFFTDNSYLMLCKIPYCTYWKCSQICLLFGFIRGDLDIFNENAQHYAPDIFRRLVGETFLRGANWTVIGALWALKKTGSFVQGVRIPRIQAFQCLHKMCCVNLNLLKVQSSLVWYNIQNKFMRP